MVILLTIVHVLVCLFLIIVVLLQSGKAADLAGAFGGMGSQTAFGPRGAATVLSKATTIAAGLFMVSSLGLSIMASRGITGGGPSPLDRNLPATPQQQQQQQVPMPGAAPSGPTSGAPVQPGQPSVTVQREGEAPVTMPLDVSKLPRVDEKGNPVKPDASKPAPPKPAAPKQ
jgi:preprotein translocase subunit SecG